MNTKPRTNMRVLVNKLGYSRDEAYKLLCDFKKETGRDWVSVDEKCKIIYPIEMVNNEYGLHHPDSIILYDLKENKYLSLTDWKAQ